MKKRKHNARNSPILADIRLVCNKAIYKEALRLANEESEAAAENYANRYFTCPVKDIARRLR